MLRRRGTAAYCADGGEPVYPRDRLRFSLLRGLPRSLLRLQTPLRASLAVRPARMSSWDARTQRTRRAAAVFLARGWSARRWRGTLTSHSTCEYGQVRLRIGESRHRPL